MVWCWGNGPHLLSETVRTIHKCRFLDHVTVNVLTVQFVVGGLCWENPNLPEKAARTNPDVNIRSRKNGIVY